MSIEKDFGNKTSAAIFIKEKNLLGRGFKAEENTLNGRTYIVLSTDESKLKTIFKIVLYAILGLVSNVYKDLYLESIAVRNDKKSVYKFSCPEEKQNNRKIEVLVKEIGGKVCGTVKLSDQIKEMIASDFTLCRLGGYEGEHVKVSYSIRYSADFPSKTCLSDTHLVRNSDKDLQNFINTYVVEYLNQNIKENYNEKHRIEIEVFIVGQLKKLGDEDIVSFQIFRQSYAGLSGNGQIGMKDEELKETFLEDIPSYVRRPIWNDQGNFTKA